jgi:peroxin-1
MELGLELAKSFVELECVALTDVQKLCTMPRYTGVQLEIVEMKRCLSASSWRYPSDDLHSTDRNSKAQELVDIRATWLNAVTHPKGVPIRVKSLFALPWDCEWSTRTYSKGVLCRVALEPDNRTEASSFASDDDSYVFTEDLEHLFTNAVQERHDNSQKKPSPSIRCSYGERVVFQGQFSLSAELSRRGTLYSGAITECAKDIHRSVLVCGGTSSGKTQTALIVAANTSVQRHVVYLDCRKLKNSKGVKLSTILHEFENLFAEAAYTMASTVVLDNLDELTPSYDSENGGTGSSHTVEQNPALKDQCIAIEGILRKYLSTQDSKSPHSLLLVVTSSDPDAISKNTSSSIGFGRTILLPNLQSAERLDMFLDLLCIHGDTSRREFHSSWHDFAKKTVGFRPGDLERLASRVRRHARYESTVSIGTVTSIELDRYVPLSKISSSTEVLDIKYSWEDVGGLFNVKRELMSTILRPLMYKQIYEKARIRLPRGILLFGPSGTGKSFIVPALAKKCGYPLIVCRGPELLSKYIGASESKVRELFARALSVAPSILFFDELDALAPRRGTDSTGVTDRVVNQLLTFLDGVEETSSMSGTVYIIASSSRPDKIDPALLRPGRLERHVYVGICEHETELTDLILQTARRNHAASDVLDYIRSGQMVHDLSVKAPHAFNFTAADLNAVFHTAHVAAAHEALALGRDTENALLRLEHVMSAFSATTPSLLNDEWTRLAKIYSSFRGIISQPSETSKNQELLKVALR